jgi:hypothetical protein
MTCCFREVQVQAPLVSFPATAIVVPEPLGVVLVFSCWNLPLGKTNLFVVHYKCLIHTVPILTNWDIVVVPPAQINFFDKGNN